MTNRHYPYIEALSQIYTRLIDQQWSFATDQLSRRIQVATDQTPYRVVYHDDGVGSEQCSAERSTLWRAVAGFAVRLSDQFVCRCLEGDLQKDKGVEDRFTTMANTAAGFSLLLPHANQISRYDAHRSTFVEVVGLLTAEATHLLLNPPYTVEAACAGWWDLCFYSGEYLRMQSDEFGTTMIVCLSESEKEELQQQLGQLTGRIDFVDAWRKKKWW